MAPLSRTPFARCLRACAGLLSLLLAVGCGGPQPAAPRPAPRPLGELTTLLPADSTVVVVARPAELLANGATERVVRALFPFDQLDRFAQRSGVDPRSLDELVIAEHPAGRVVLARGPYDAPFAVREAGERMAPLESSTEQPRVRRVGFLGNRRVDLTALSPHAVLWIEGAPQLAAEVLAAADRAESERRHALAISSAAALRRAAGDAPFALYALAPLGLPLDTGIGMLLARERALSAWARPSDGGALQIAVELHGEFPDGAGENFRALARSIGDTDLGAALGVPDAIPTLRIEAEPRRVRASAELDPGVLAVGLRTLLYAEMRELLGEGAPEGSTESPPGVRRDHP